MLGILEYARNDCNLNCIKYGNYREIEKEVAGAAGLEPATIGFGDRCSTNWNYAPAKWMPIILTNKLKTRVKDAQSGICANFRLVLLLPSAKNSKFPS